MGKRDHRAMLGCNNDRLCPEKYTIDETIYIDHISNTKQVQRILLMPSGHPIILLKSN